jgi:long-chain acyl-CoA synthetase
MKEKLWYKSYAPGIEKNLKYEKLTISNALTRSAERFPDNVAIDFMGKRITYKELNGMVNQFSRALIDLGVKKGDKVAVCIPNIPQLIVANLAIFRIGAVAVQNNPLYSERELQYQLDDSDSTVIITFSLLVPRVQKIMSGTKIKKIIACHIHSYLPFPVKQLFPIVKKAMYRKIEPTEDLMVFKDLIEKYSTEPVKDVSKWDELSTLLYTGGTTGVSKGVMLSHANISSNVQQIVGWFTNMDPGVHQMVGTIPVFHSAGFTVVQNVNIWQGWENILIARPEAETIAKIVKKYKPTILPGVPTIFVGLLNNPKFRNMDLSFIRGFFSGAAPLAMDTIRDLKELTGASMVEVYGMTEASPVATGTPWGGEIKEGTVGIPFPDTDVKIMDVETGKKEMKVGESGEIIIKGPQIMMGYYKKPEETKNSLKKGYFYTGDIGILDEDGYLKIVDRKKDMIIAGGYNIYPVELDNTLFDHPKILEACTIGVPDKYRGETVKAFIVPKPGETLTEEEVVAFCKEKLAAYKVPKIIEFMDELPKSAIGKILRRELKEMERKRAEK